MATVAPAQASILDQKLKDNPPAKWGVAAFALVLVAGVIYIISRLSIDLSSVHQASIFPYILLGHRPSHRPRLRVRQRLPRYRQRCRHRHLHPLARAAHRRGLVRHCGTSLASSPAPARSPSPSSRCCPSSSSSRSAKAPASPWSSPSSSLPILWNLATWWRGLPVSSSHTMIGSILGVGLANQFMQRQLRDIRRRLGAGHQGLQSLDLFADDRIRAARPSCSCSSSSYCRDPRLYKAPEGTAPPPLYIRALLILTCTGVSFAHGSNDGQKGMGLIMLILVGTVPTAYALNHTVDRGSVADVCRRFHPGRRSAWQLRQ